MANPTTNFGWVMPTSSSLVTNLPADFNTFGQAVDTSMQYLLGGTTGQVLSKTSATNMAFTWVTPTDQTPLTTKGDLFTFTTVDARLAVGNNGETLVADSAATSGLRYQPAYNGNAIINGGMDIWQRGTSFTSVAATYTADRWFGARPGNAVGLNISRQVTGDTTNLPTIQYCLRAQRASANANTDSYYIGYNLETTDSIRFAGQTVVLSFYARAGANYSPTSSGFIANIYTGTGTDQNVNSGFTGSANPSSVTHTLTTTWQRFQQTVTLSASATQVGFLFIAVPTGTASTNDYFEITGVQFELGARSTTFKRSNGAGGSIQGELAACQRYYYQIATGTSVPISLVWYDSATLIRGLYQMPVTMRSASPTLVQTTGTNYYSTQDGDGFNSLTLYNASTSTLAWYNNTEVSGTNSRPQGINTNNASASLGISAEL